MGKLTEALAVTTALVLISAVFLWPLSPHPGRLVIANPDVFGNAWTLAWIVHQTFTNPLRLYDANIYWPIPGVLGLTETQFPQALLASPMLAAGGDAILAHNVVVLLSFPLCGVAAYLLARDLTGSRVGAFLAALTYAFCAYRFYHLVHVQSLAMQWLPAALFAIRRALATRAGAWSIAASVLFGFALLGSGYYVLITVFAVGTLLLAERAWRNWNRPLALGLATALFLAFLAYLPHRAALQREAKARGGPIERTAAETSHWSAHWSSYLDPGGHVILPHQDWLARRTHTREPLFPTTVVLLLAIAGSPFWTRTRQGRWAGVLLVTGLLLSLGPLIPIGPLTIPGPFELLRRLPGGALLRTPSRLGVLAILGFALLAAAAWAEIERRRVRHRHLLGAVAIAAVLAETHPYNLARLMTPLAPPPATTAWLATAPSGPVLELPWDHETEGLGATYVYWSTRHWQPMVNGWSAFEPRGPFAQGVLGKMFPSDYTAQQFRQAGIRYVVVHTDLIPADRPGRIGRATRVIDLPAGVRLAASMGPDRIYEIERATRKKP